VPPVDEARLERLTHSDELALLRKLADFPADIRRAATSRGPHQLTVCGRELAALFHQFYTTCQVIDPAQPDLTGARLRLVDGTRTVLATVCRLLGINAPERM
jgi:arginyl-tRNA synthetase